MLPYFTEQFGNPAQHQPCLWPRSPPRRSSARGRELAALIDADPREIVFTSGATEANNLAIKGAAHFARAHAPAVPPRPHRDPGDRAQMRARKLRALEREGFAVTYLPVEPDGLVDLGKLTAALDERTLLVSVMAAHNEIGVIQPLAEIGALCRAKRRAASTATRRRRWARSRSMSRRCGST